MIKLSGHTSITLQDGNLSINLKAPTLSNENFFLKAIDTKIENIEKQMQHLTQAISQRKTSGGKRFRARQQSIKRQMALCDKKISLLIDGKRVLPDYLLWVAEHKLYNDLVRHAAAGISDSEITESDSEGVGPRSDETDWAKGALASAMKKFESSGSDSSASSSLELPPQRALVFKFEDTSSDSSDGSSSGCPPRNHNISPRILPKPLPIGEGESSDSDSPYDFSMRVPNPRVRADYSHEITSEDSSQSSGYDADKPERSYMDNFLNHPKKSFSKSDEIDRVERSLASAMKKFEGFEWNNSDSSDSSSLELPPRKGAIPKSEDTSSESSDGTSSSSSPRNQNIAPKIPYIAPRYPLPNFESASSDEVIFPTDSSSDDRFYSPFDFSIQDMGD